MEIKKAVDIMSTDVVTTREDVYLTAVMQILLERRISGLPVVDDDGCLKGIVSEIDLVNSMLSGNAADTVVGEIMSTDVTSFPPSATCAEIASCFTENRIRRVPIVEKCKVIGIVSRRDVLKELLSEYNQITSA